VLPGPSYTSMAFPNKARANTAFLPVAIENWTGTVNSPYNVAQNEEGPSPFEPGPSDYVVIDYFLIFAFRARAAEP
jgi:hypothetical protein